MKSRYRIWLNTIAVIALLQLASRAFGQTCLTIQSGLIKAENGNTVTLGFDQWGYNYQAHIYEGLYANFPRPSTPYTEETCGAAGYGELGCTQLQMKWSDSWLSNKSCDGDTTIDRHFGFTGYRGSGAWLTNHFVGSYTQDGDLIHWTDFVKVIAAPLSAYRCSEASCDTFDSNLGFDYYGEGKYFTSNTLQTEIGPVIWGDFAVIQEVWNDPGMGLHGILFHSPANPGLGYWGNQP